MKKADISSYEKIVQLFNSLVKSITLHASEVEDANHLKDVLRLQNGFFKRLLYLPKCTLHCAIRREMQLEYIECKVLKLTLNWIAKILRMSDDRYPKSVLKMLLEADINSETNMVEYNWIALVRKRFLHQLIKPCISIILKIFVDQQT